MARTTIKPVHAFVGIMPTHGRGNIMASTASFEASVVRREIASWFDKPNGVKGTWASAYRLGYRVKRCIITIPEVR
jgi:hypothetical protein